MDYTEVLAVAREKLLPLLKQDFPEVRALPMGAPIFSGVANVEPHCWQIAVLGLPVAQCGLVHESFLTGNFFR